MSAFIFQRFRSAAVRIAFAAALLSVYTISNAQFTDSTRYHFGMLSSGSVNRTNSNIAYLLNNSLNFGLKTKSARLTTTNSWIYGNQNEKLTNNDFSSTNFFNLYKTFPRFYYWALLNYVSSYSLKVNNQLQSGGGIAYSLIDTSYAYINISDGILYDQSNLVGNADYHTVRNSLRLQYRFVIKKVITIDASNYFQQSFSHSGDYIIRSSTTFAIKLKKWLSLATALTYNRMNITNSDNLNFTFGLAVDGYF